MTREVGMGPAPSSEAIALVFILVAAGVITLLVATAFGLNFFQTVVVYLITFLLVRSI